MTFLEKIRNRDPIPEAKVRWLGRHDGYEYGEHNGREYAVSTRPADVGSFSADPDERLIARRSVELLDDGEQMVTTVHHRAWPVKPGSYAKLARTRKPADRDKPMRGWDRLAALPAMQRREPMRLATGPAPSMLDGLVGMPLSGTEQEAIAGALFDQARHNSKSTLIEFGGNSPPERSMAALVAWLAERHGIELTLARGRLRARSVKPIRADLQALLDQVQELIIGHLQGRAVMCGDCAEPAVTIASVNVPACAEHAQ